MITMSDRIIEKTQNPPLLNCYYSHYFNHLLEVYEFTVAIQKAAWKSTPTIKRKLKWLNFPKEIQDKIAAKRKLRKRWHQTKVVQDKTALNRATNQMSREIEEVK